MFSCLPSINKNKDLENWNSNIFEVPMSRTSYKIVSRLFSRDFEFIETSPGFVRLLGENWA